MNLSAIIQDAHKLALLSQKEVLRIFKSELQKAKIVSAEGKDIKLEADLAISEFLITKLETSGYAVVSEEKPGTNRYSDKIHWVIDPLDGSFNMSRGFPFYCCSIALVQGQKPLYGNILNLFDESMIFGGYDLPSGLALSSNQELSKAVLATGFPLEFNFNDKASNILEFYSQFKKIRMIGSAASSLSLVAKGIFDLYYEKNIYFWDVAAGLAIIEASGGNYKAQFETDSWKLNVVAGNKHLTGAINL